MEYELDQVYDLCRRLEKLAIKLECIGNYPWIYLDKVNGNKVKEKFLGDHGFTIAFLPIKRENKFLVLTDTAEIFKIIRKYGKKKQST